MPYIHTVSGKVPCDGPEPMAGEGVTLLADDCHHVTITGELFNR